MGSELTQAICQQADRFDFVAAHFNCERDRFSPSNPNGYVNFGSAQNFLQSHRRQELLGCFHLHENESDFHYQLFHGTVSCRQSVADYLASIAKTSVDADDIVVGNGIISILEALAVALLDPEDCCLVPTPVFPGLVAALSLRVKSRIAWMHTSHENGFRVTPGAIETELAHQKLRGSQVRAILLCSPGNPVGQVYTAKELAELAEIAQRFDCALIVDEVYASSCFDSVEFVSGISLRQDHVYVLGGLSKDFGLAGYATGWLHSTNRDVMRAMRKQSHFYRLPTPIQRLIEQFLEPRWRDLYLRDHRSQLTQKHQQTTSLLNKFGVDVVNSESGLCLWLDLRQYLPSLDKAGEMTLYQFMLQRQRVHISPGNGFHANEFGFFRICFSHDDESLLEGIRRLTDGLSVGPAGIISQLDLITEAR